MAAARKPTTQSRSNTTPRLAVVPAAVEPQVPELPDGDWRDESHQAWVALWSEPQSAALVGAQRTVALRWIEAFDAWRRAMDVVKSEPLVEGSQGQPVQNPMMAWVTSREAEMEKCERQLGIGLRNRADLGISTATARLTAGQLNAMARKEPAGASNADKDDGGEAEVLEGWEAG